MSVNINFKQPTNDSKWESVETGDYLLLEGTPNHPIPKGLYRIFIYISDVDPTDNSNNKTVCLVPLFDGPFEPNMFPYMCPDINYPTIIQKINKVNIDAEVTQ